MTTYEGIYEKDYKVFAQGLPLPCYKVYTESRDWTTEDGRKQLALDILIDFLQESPSPIDIVYKETEIAAWVPHLAYAELLKYTLLLLPPSPLGRLWWRIQSAQVRTWLDDWLQEHSKNALTYTNWKYALNQRVGRRFHEFDEADLMTSYMYGWSPDRALAAMD